MSKQAKLLLVMAALVLGAASAALSQEAAPQGAAPTRPVAAVKAAPATEPSEDARRAQALVTFGDGKSVTIGELEDAMKRQSPHLRKRFTEPAERKDLLDKTLRFALLADEAERRGYGKNPDVVQSVKQNAVQALMRDSFSEESLASAVTDAEIKAYYDEHISEYQRPAVRRASQIVVATADEAKQVLEEAKKADLRTFRTLAREKSIDEASKLRGGDLQYFDAKGKAHPSGEVIAHEAIAKAVSTLKNVGDVAPASIKVDAGFAIVKLTGERPAISRKLAEVSETIRSRIARVRRQEAIDTYVKGLHEQYKPELFAERASAIVLDTSDLPGPGVPHGFPHDRVHGSMGKTSQGAAHADPGHAHAEGEGEAHDQTPQAPEGE